MYGPVHAFNPRRVSDVPDSNHMSGWLERDSPVSTDTAGRQRMISQFHCVGHVLPELRLSLPRFRLWCAKIVHSQMTLKSRQQHAGDSWGCSVMWVICFENLQVSHWHQRAGEPVKTGMDLIYGWCRHTAPICKPSVNMKTTPVDSELQLNCSLRSSLTHRDIKVSFTTPINSFALL